MKPLTYKNSSGLPDKQNITLSLRSIGENVNSLIVGSVITCKADVTNAYFALFNGTDVDRPRESPADDPAIVRYFLDAEECGACNGYAMGM